METYANMDDKTLKSLGIIKQKEDNRYSVRLLGIGGILSGEHMQAIGTLSEQYAAGKVHLTARQGVEIPHVPKEALDDLVSQLEAHGVQLGLTGPKVRGITACPGIHCTHGLIDAKNLAYQVYDHTQGGRLLPHKFKIGITGCINSCLKPMENDLGIQGAGPDRYALYVGGKMGRRPRLGDKLPLTCHGTDCLMQAVSETIDWYSEHGEAKERFGDTLDRVGVQSLTERLITKEAAVAV